MVQPVEEQQRTQVDIAYMIPLTRGMFALIDECDYNYVRQFTYRAVPGRTTMYAARHDNDGEWRTTTYMHIDIMGELNVDHRDHNGLNNRRSNLRLATFSQNAYNKPPLHGKKYKGVYATKHNGWKVLLYAEGRYYYGGVYNTQEEAAMAYDRLAKQHHGEFAYLNLPDEPYTKD